MRQKGNNQQEIPPTIRINSSISSCTIIRLSITVYNQAYTPNAFGISNITENSKRLLTGVLGLLGCAFLKFHAKNESAKLFRYFLQ